MDTTFLDTENYIQKYKNQAKLDRKNHWKKFLNLIITLFVVVFAISFISGVIFGDSFLGNLLLQLISFFITLFSMKYVLNLIDNKVLNYKEIVKSLTWKQFFYGLLAYIITIALTYLGFILLVVPGVIVLCMLIMVTPIIADRTMKPLATLKESRRLTDNYKMKIFKTIFSVGIYYMLIPILIVLVGLFMIMLNLPVWILFILGIVYILSILWANFALITLLPRMYRDLCIIKSMNVTEDVDREKNIEA